MISLKYNPKIELYKILEGIYNSYSNVDYYTHDVLRPLKVKIFYDICFELDEKLELYNYNNYTIVGVGYHRYYGFYLNLEDSNDNGIDFLYDWSEVYLID